ncbi:hypothetical protein T484DRAFT_1648903, partial [Baffinella frigidus]
MWSARMGQADGVKQLLADRASVASKDSHGRTALQWAARVHAEVAVVLLDAGAHPGAPDKEGTAPLHWA